MPFNEGDTVLENSGLTKLVLPGAIIREGEPKSLDPHPPMIWDNFSIFLEQIAPY